MAITDHRYGDFARELVATNIINDPWIGGRPRFRLEPVVLDIATWRGLCRAAERLGRAFDEAARIVWSRPALLDDYFHLTPYQKLMWLASDARWHGIARLDLFLLSDGSIRCCEMNSDTPSGEAEAVILNRLLHPRHPLLLDPNASFESRFVATLEAFLATTGRGEGGTVGIVYPTDLPEDLSMIALYRGWLESRGYRVALGAPDNLGAVGGRLTLMGVAVDAIIRHYKTDWWGEREPAWRDEAPYDDPDPLDGPLRLLLEADMRRSAAVMNPFGSVVVQNKLMMALLWDHLSELSTDAADAVRAYLPETRRLADVDPGSLRREEWVLKSDYGCEGDEVVIGPTVDDAVWREALARAIPERWIVQRYFDASAADLAIANHGVYLLGGEAAGIYTRVSRTATDVTALSAPTFIEAATGAAS